MTRGSARLRSNLSANILGTGISSLVALATAPLVFRWFGADAYGLVGVYLLLQGLMPLFDLGITPGLARAVSWHRGAGSEGQVVTLVRLAERPMLLFASAFGLGILALSGVIERRWLVSVRLPASSVRVAIILMGVALALRMLSGLQKSALMAIEHQMRANLVQSFAVLARTLGALVFAVATGTGILGFFVVQVPVSILEWCAYRRLLFGALPRVAQPVGSDELRMHARFALGVAGLAVLWLLTSQVDKLTLSRILPLAEFGAYALGVHIASAVIIATGPVQAAVLPRLTRLIAAGDETQARLLYGMATALTVALAASLTVGISVAAPLVIAVMRPAETLYVNPMHIASAYALGNCAIAIVALSYQLQNARGRLRLHAAGTIVQAVVQIPILIWVASTLGAFATALAFAGLNWLFVLVWTPIVHARFLDGGALPWLSRDLLPPLLLAVAAGSVVLYLMSLGNHSIAFSCAGALVGMAFTMAATLFAHADLRLYLRRWWRPDGG
ncbi:MAG TPA: lipopolysaccharide biosynthesis protein [Rhodanobacter sp.]|jgi:O-antigen/teichoic acid export membrane protein|nr:lipopolysaccharide biosynthesis protein [Rhodanobacter sp.]